MTRRIALLSTGVATATAGALAYRRLRRGGGRGDGRVERSVTIDRPAEEVYRFCRDPANLPGFAERVSSAEPRGTDRVGGTVELAGRGVEWEAAIVEDRPGEAIAWDARLSGSLTFRPAPGDRGTEVRLILEAVRPRRLSKGLEWQAAEDLRRLKRLLETGEIATTEGQPTG